MSLIGIVNLAERLLNQTPGQNQDAQSNNKAQKPAASNPLAVNEGDQFTHSLQTAQEAGLFQVNQFNLFSVAADSLLAQAAGQPQANQAVPAVQATGTSQVPTQNQPTVPAPEKVTQSAAAALPVASAPPPPVPANAKNPAISTTQAASVAVAISDTTVFAAAPATASPILAPTTSAATSALNSLSALQALNNALANLGLSNQQLAQIDRIATLIQDFNPLAFTALAQQLEAIAQANPPQPAAAPAPAATTPQQAFQLQSITIRFSAAQATGLQANNGQARTTAAQASDFNFQIEEVSFTLVDQNGQLLQVTAPPPTSSVNSNAAPAAPLARAAFA